jgi:hypothetical protein
VPEEVIVLETIGTVESFISAVRRTEGLEWLGEIEEEDIPADDDFFAVDTHGRPRAERRLSGRMFLVFSNDTAFEQMQSFWRAWQRGTELPRGLKKWAELFGKLRALRPWGVQDRLIETGVLEDWKEWIDNGRDRVPCEIELWFRPGLGQREASRGRVGTLLRDLGGTVLQESTIPEIGYQAMLAELPVSFVEPLVRGAAQDAALVQCQQIQFFRAAGQAVGILKPGQGIDLAASEAPAQASLGAPVVALLDGLPLQNHQLLAGRLVIDDPDGFEEGYQAGDRRHGTAMASLIVHGDKNRADPPLARSVYVRPIFRPDPRDWRSPRDEAVPATVLAVDLVHRAVRRLFESEGSQPPVAQTVRIINLSIGIRDRPFYDTMSPLARLLDWLAWKYQVLFVVSAGNHDRSIEPGVSNSELRSIPPEDLQQRIIRAVASDARHRRLLAPAEAINALTVGALHEDGSAPSASPRTIEPYVDRDLPSPINAQGLGYRRAIKPEILAPGGKVALLPAPGANSSAVLDIYDGTLAPGQLVAAPGPAGGGLSHVWHTRGTSNSAAIASRTAAILYDVLEELRQGPRGEIVDTTPRAVLIKALLVHAAFWGPAGEVMTRALLTPQNSRQFKEYLSRLIGYGCIDPARASECTPQRVTAIGGGSLGDGQAQVHRLPLPPALSGVRGWRRLVVTMAWNTPVNPSHHAWRRSQLWFDPPRDTLKVARKEADWHAVQRGTCQHEVLEGEQAAAFVDGDSLLLQVNCRADAGALQESVPYAIAVTLEVAEALGIDIYAEVSARVVAQVQVAPAP